jgi:hypothetical protein
MKSQIKNIIKSSNLNVYNFILILIIISIFLVKVINLKYGIDSIFDEGFLLLKIQTPTFRDPTLFASIVNIFLTKSSDTILNLKYLKFSSQIIIVIFLTYSILKYFELDNNKILITCFIFIFFIPSFDLYTSIFSYNHIQQLLIFVGISFILLSQKKKRPIYLTFLIGITMFISIINIPPSGIIYSIFISLLVLIQNKIYVEKRYLIFILFLGLLFSFIVFNFFVSDIIDWIFNLYKKISDGSNLQNGYDTKHFFNSIYEYLYHFIKLCLYYSFFSILYLYFSKFKYSIVILILFFVLIISDLYFLNTLDSIYLFPLIVTLIEKRKRISKFIFIYKLLIFIAILLPFLFSLGTNTSLATKSLYFIPIWSILILLLIKDQIDDKIFLNNFIILLLIPTLLNQFKWFENSKNINGNFSTSVYHSKNSRISKIGIRIEQKKYFQKVKNICSKYKFSKNDYTFSFQLDAMTQFILETKVIGPFFQPLDYLLVKDKSILPQPKFIFLNQYEYDRTIDTLTKYYSDYPENYDKYFIGTPEIANVGYSTERWLYCRKIKNVKNVTKN